jgi:hypothetical protein
MNTNTNITKTKEILTDKANFIPDLLNAYNRSFERVTVFKLLGSSL